jgi:hypothetical protein
VLLQPTFLEISGILKKELYNDFDITNLIAESDRSFIENLEANALNNTHQRNYEFRKWLHNG